METAIIENAESIQELARKRHETTVGVDPGASAVRVQLAQLKERTSHAAKAAQQAHRDAHGTRHLAYAAIGIAAFAVGVALVGPLR